MSLTQQHTNNNTSGTTQHHNHDACYSLNDWRSALEQNNVNAQLRNAARAFRDLGLENIVEFSQLDSKLRERETIKVGKDCFSLLHYHCIARHALPLPQEGETTEVKVKVLLSIYMIHYFPTVVLPTLTDELERALIAATSSLIDCFHEIIEYIRLDAITDPTSTTVPHDDGDERSPFDNVPHTVSVGFVDRLNEYTERFAAWHRVDAPRLLSRIEDMLTRFYAAQANPDQVAHLIPELGPLANHIFIPPSVSPADLSEARIRIYIHLLREKLSRIGGEERLRAYDERHAATNATLEYQQS